MDYPRIDTESPRRTPVKGLGKYVPHQNVRERNRRLKQLGRAMRHTYERASSGTGEPDVLINGDGVYVRGEDRSVTFHPHEDLTDRV